jgi:hypothetical protein
LQSDPFRIFGEIFLTMRILLITTSILFSRVCLAQFGEANDLLHPTHGASSVLTIDVDADGDMDVISSSFYSDEITVFENPGNSIFRLDLIHVVSSLADGAKYVTAFDFDGDGDPDLLSASVEDQTIAIFENLGNCAFGPEIVVNTSIPSVNRLHVADMDNDGLSDIVVTSSNYIDWIKNTGNWTFNGELHITSLPNQRTVIEVKDINNDNNPDIIWGGTLSPDLSLITNLGNGTFSASALISNQSYYLYSIETCDINGDPFPDLVTADDTGIKQFINNGSGGFAAPVLLQSIQSCRSASMLDMDDDGDKDIVWSMPGSYSAQMVLYWSRNDGSGNYTVDYPFTISTLLNGDLGVSINDLDNDGDKDIVTSTSVDGKVACYINIADTTFEPQRLLSSSSAGVSSVITADFDNDGFEDIVSASQDGKVSYFNNNGDGQFAIQRILYDQLDWVGETGASTLRAGDMDQDGDPDIVAFCAYHSYVNGNNPTQFYWLENTGNDQFVYHQLYATGQENVLESGYTDLILADTDLDGDLDILTSHRDANRIRLYRNLGDGSFSGSTSVAFVTNGYCISAADVDNDGLPDIVSGSVNVSWFKNTGNNTFGPEQIVAENVGQLSTIETADIDGDNDPDILSGNYFSATSSWYENTGNGVFGPEQIIHTEGFYVPIAVHAADIDADGDQDVLAVGSWHENTGNGVFGTPQALGTGGLAFGNLLTADLDNDGDPEVIGDLLWYENQLMDESNVGGRLFADMDQDNQFGPGDFGIPYASVFVTPESDFAYSFQDGNYVVHLSDEVGQYLVQPGTIPHWSVTTDSLFYHIAIDSSATPFDSLDFGFFPTDTVHELAPFLTGGFPRCNTIVNYWIDLTNTGTTMPSGVLRLNLDEHLTYVGSAYPPDSVNGQDIYWHYDSLMYFAQEQWEIQIQMPDFTAMGDTLTSHLVASVIEPNGGTPVIFFSDDLTQELVCAYDPNDKTVEPAGFGVPGYIHVSTEWLEYTVRFQNTGNDTAMQVVITDQLDADLDWQSLQPLAQSHPLSIGVDQNGLATFTFANIHLPDSTTNELASHGFIRYRVHLDAGLDTGTVITNTASIYFDQNPAVVTNTTLNTLYVCTPYGINEPLDPVFCEGELIEAGIYNLPASSDIVWTIAGVVQQNGQFFSWIADTSGSFTLQVTADNGICNIDVPIYLTVNETTDAHISGPESDTICLQDGTINLPEATPAGGSFYGNGVWGLVFDPVVSGTGDQLVTYVYSNANGCYGRDSLMITVEDCLGLTELSTNSVLLFPNPVVSGGELVLQWTQEPNGSYELTIKNMLGEPVYNKTELNGSTQTIVLPELSAGVYWAVVTDSSGIRVVRQLVIH